jgi:hypothetical protein
MLPSQNSPIEKFFCSLKLFFTTFYTNRLLNPGIFM